MSAASKMDFEDNTMTVQFAPIFQDHAVLQRDILIPVWGVALPGTEVEVRLGTVGRARALTADNGRWELRLPTCGAGGPFALGLFVDGKERITLCDILVGDVWLCSGQSNMQYTLGQVDADGVQSAAADHPHVRLLNVATEAGCLARTEVRAKWQVCTAESIVSFSAVGGWFGRLLQAEIGVPIGLICNAWGGTRIESWLSRNALMQFPETAAQVHANDVAQDRHNPSPVKSFANADEWFRCVGPENPVNLGFENSWHSSSFDDCLWQLMHLPQRWQDAGHPFNGIFWFRRTVRIPADWSSETLTLELGAIDKHDDTFVNGHRIGGLGWETIDAWCTPRVYNIAPAVHKGAQELVIAVRVRSHLWHGGMTGPDSRMRIYPAAMPGNALSLSGDWRFAVEQNWGEVVVPGDALDSTRPGGCNAPSAMFLNRLHPIIPYGLMGFLWYQGESNADQAGRYALYLPALIAEWRYLWAQGHLPFGIVQLANYQQPKSFDADSHWANLREVQRRIAAAHGNGLAVCIDIGDAADIHPVDKLSVARRLLRWALADVYGMGGPAGGPALQRVEVGGAGIMRLHFKDATGLRTRDGKEVCCLVIAGSDGAFKPAFSRINGESLEVWHPEIGFPVAVRYAWADNPEGANLINAFGLPAAPFKGP